MQRRAFLRRLGGAAAFGRLAATSGRLGLGVGSDALSRWAGARALLPGWAHGPDALVRELRARGGWAARLDDAAYGGRGDGTTLNDEPLLQALADMPAEGGTLVVPPAGDWLFDAVDLARVGRKHATLVDRKSVV